MTIEEKLQHFYDTSVTEAQEEARKDAGCPQEKPGRNAGKT